MKDPLEDCKILVIDDEPALLELLDTILTGAGASVETAPSAAAGIRCFYAFRPDLVLLDLLMPEMSGWEVFDRLRQMSDVPIIMLTALADTGYVARGLDRGADDYVTKPFVRSVLLARIRAVLRRTESVDFAAPGRVYDDGYLSIDFGRHQVHVRQAPIHLTPTEYNLLVYLFQHADRVLTYSQILEDVWGPECIGAVQYIHAYLHRLRLKLEPDPDRPHYLLTEAGIGCRFHDGTGFSKERADAAKARPEVGFRP